MTGDKDWLDLMAEAGARAARWGTDPDIESLRKHADRVLAEIFDRAGNTASGLDLSEIDEDGHALANRLWKVSGYLKRRAAQ